MLSGLWSHAEAHDPGPEDLPFSLDLFTAPVRRRVPLVDVAALGVTEPKAQARSYTAGRCRCVHCRRAFAEYRSQRRLAGLDQPRGPRVRDSDGHLPAQWFRDRFWKPACPAAGIDPPVRLHDLRHALASWLLAGGADLQVVEERLGHRSIPTTEKYLHTRPDADETALSAPDRVGRGGTTQPDLRERSRRVLGR